MGVGGEVERRRLQAAVRELGIQGATQVFIGISVFFKSGFIIQKKYKVDIKLVSTNNSFG